MKTTKINDNDIQWFLSVFDFKNFIDETDYVKKSWVKQGRLFITEWFDPTEINDIEKENILSLFKDQQSEVSLTFFPMNKENQKFLFHASHDLLDFLSHDKVFAIVPILIYNSKTILIFEPDLELLIIIYIDERDKILNFHYFDHQEYLLKIQEMKERGLI